MLEILKKDKRNIEQYKNEIVLSENAIKLLNEELGAFKEQYDLALELSQVIYQMIIHNQKVQTYYPRYNNRFEKVIINLKLGVLNSAYASLTGLNREENSLSISIIVHPSIIMKNKDIALQAISNAITHELMHGNIYFHRIDKNLEDIEDTPEYYGKLALMRSEIDADSVAYLFSYALYATFYQEVNAIVSQTAIQMRQLMKDKEYNIVNLNAALKQTEPFSIYSEILYQIVPMVEKMNNKQIEMRIVNIFQEYGVESNVNVVRKQCQWIKKVAKDALNHIIKNSAYRYLAIGKTQV